MTTPTYPGVYIQEIPSGNRTIVGVATSTTAFVGRARRGPTAEATVIRSWGDFQRVFGGLWVESPMSYAVSHFFAAGGSRAVIVRVTSSAGTASTGAITVPVSATSPVAFLRLEDARTGTYTGNVGVVISGTDPEAFVLTVYEGSGTTWTVKETHSVTTIGSIEDVLSTSDYVRIVGSVPAHRPINVGSTSTPTVVELTSSNAATAAASFLVTLPATGSITFAASSGGVWANRVYLAIDHDTSEEDCALFNLTIEERDADGVMVVQEVFRNVSVVDTHARYVATVIEEQSELLGSVTIVAPVGLNYEDGAWRPAETSTDLKLTGGTDGTALTSTNVIGTNGASATLSTGMYAVAQADVFNLLCLPPPTFSTDIATSDWALALAFCEDNRAICIADAPASWTSTELATDTSSGFATLGLTSENGAMYFPRVKIADPLRENRLTAFAPCGAVAGLIAKTDSQRGIWKAPAGLEARTPIVRGLEVNITDTDNGELNPLGLNCLRTFRGVGTVVWGGRTLAGSDRISSDWKYLPVRRLALHIEESLYRGLQWAVFEPNDEPLWSQIRLSAGTFMGQLFRQGAFKGSSPKDAYFVKCDSETTTDADVDRGIVNVLVGFAPLKPAEFVIISLQQIAGQVGA